MRRPMYEFHQLWGYSTYLANVIDSDLLEDPELEAERKISRIIRPSGIVTVMVAERVFAFPEVVSK